MAPVPGAEGMEVVGVGADAQVPIAGPGTRSTAFQVFAAALTFYALEAILLHGPSAGWLRLIFRQNRKLNARQLDYAVKQACCRIVGSVHFLIQIPIALMVIYSPEMTNRYGRLYATNGLTRTVLTVSAGYFLYDAFVCIVRYEGLTFMLHGVFASILYTYGALSGSLGYYAALFVLWEISTPFVYMRWLLHTLGKSKSREYLINGFAMMGAFFLCRNVAGFISSLEFWEVSGRELMAPALNRIGGHAGIPHTILWGIRLANCMFITLNTIWFYKMVKGALNLLGGRPHKGGPGDINTDAPETEKMSLDSLDRFDSLDATPKAPRNGTACISIIADGSLLKED